MNNISKHEWKFVTIFSVVLMIITLLPVFYNYTYEPDGYQFAGLVANPGDSNTYFDYMNQAAKGKLSFINSYTSEDMKPLLIRPLWWFMGLFTAFIPSIIVWHFFRVLLGVLLLLTFYKYSARFFSQTRDRKLLLLIFGLTSGFGYFLLQANKLFGTSILTVDLGITEAIPFLSFNGAPHFIISFVLMIAIMDLFERYIATSTTKLLFAGFLTFLMGFIHVYNLVTIFMVTGFYLLYLLYKKFDWNMIKRAILFYGIGSLSGIYYFIVFTFDPVYSNWTSQNILYSPSFQKIFLGLGPLYILGLFGAIVLSFALLKKYKQAEKYTSFIFLIFWLLINTLILYAPVSFQIRFLEGIFIPGTLLGFLTVKFVLEQLKLNKIYVVLFILYIVLFSVTNLYVFSNYFDLPLSETRYAGRYYISDTELDLLIWLEENSQDSEIVLANPSLSNFIPRYSGNKVYVGHWAQTIDYQEKLQKYILDEYDLQDVDIILHPNSTIERVS